MSLAQKHKSLWTPAFTRSVLIGLLFLVAAMIISSYANVYVADRVSSPVTDLILSNIRVYDVDGLIVYGAVAVILFVVGVVIWRPKSMPFVIKSVAIFVLIRAVFISLTHIAPFPVREPITVGPILQLLGLGSTAGLFFSGHTGLPFLMALIFWENKTLRYIFLGSSVILGLSVILGHEHYSIDVFAAFFITYSIFHMAQKLFPSDWRLAISELD